MRVEPIKLEIASNKRRVQDDRLAHDLARGLANLLYDVSILRSSTRTDKALFTTDNIVTINQLNINDLQVELRRRGLSDEGKNIRSLAVFANTSKVKIR